MSYQRCLIHVLIACFASSMSSAEPEVRFKTDGSYEVVGVTAEMLSGIRSLPLYTETEGGEFVRGIRYGSPVFQSTSQCIYPGFMDVYADGTWRIRNALWTNSACHHPRKIDNDYVIPGSESVRILKMGWVGIDEDRAHARGGGSAVAGADESLDFYIDSREGPVVQRAVLLMLGR